MRILREAKRALGERYGDEPWFRGVGIVPTDDGLALRLNVDPATAPLRGELPAELSGIPIEIVFLNEYRARSAE